MVSLLGGRVAGIEGHFPVPVLYGLTFCTSDIPNARCCLNIVFSARFVESRWALGRIRPPRSWGPPVLAVTCL